jgi:hypothetical protein
MVKSSVGPGRQVWRARFMSVINVPMRFLLRLPFATPLSGRLMLISFTGRKTSKSYEQPVSYTRDGDTLLTPGGGKWKLNLREGQFIQVRLRGRSVLARPEFIKGVDDVERLLLKMMASNPGVTAFVPVKGPDGEIDRGKVEAAVRYGFSIIRWHFDAVKP